MKKMNDRSLKFGSYAFVLTAVVVAIIVLFNAVLGLDSVRNRVRFDITKNKLYSLSQPSITMLKSLNKDVDVIVLTEEKNFSVKEILEVLKQYNIKSNGKVKLKFVDVEKDPTFIKRELDPEQTKGIQEGSIVVKSGNKSKVVTQDEMVEYDYSTSGYPQASGVKIEQAFSSAIKSVTSESTPVIYFVKGHGEITKEEQLSDLTASIASNNYEIKDLSLSGDIPQDASAIIFAAPKTDLLPKEREKLQAYLDKGGDAIFLMDVQGDTTELTNFNLVMQRYALGVNNDYVLEGDQNWYYNDFNIIIPHPTESDVTKSLDPNSLFVYLPNCRSVVINQNAKDYVKPTALFMTSDKSQSRSLVTNKDSNGPFLLGAISEIESSKPSKIAVIGNAQFVTNDWMKSAGNNGTRYVISILNWMQDKTDSVIVPSKSLAQQPLNLSEQSKFIAFIMLAFVLPLAVIGLGVFVFVRRKHL
ncbi:MAG: GldG family protein [Clostridia bacterium]|nr:GldG family protein [Clostridia bacterium]